MAPWELLEQPVVWQQWATEAEAAEARAKKQRHDSEQRKSRLKK